VEQSTQPEVVQGGPASLPPEVEAELRRRLGQPPVSMPAEENGLPRPEGGSPATPPVSPPSQSVTRAEEPDVPLSRTLWTMLFSVVFTAQVFGWAFSIGYVLCILAHELGHFYVARRLDVPVTAPVFLPGFGAFVRLKGRERTAWEEALIGIGGPTAGMLAGMLCMWLHALTGNPVTQRLAFAGFAINLVNLMPAGPLDGGWIARAVSPKAWLIGLIGLVALIAAGPLRQPLLIVVVVVSLARLWQEWQRKGDVSDGRAATPRQGLAMALFYVSLCGLLALLLQQTHWTR
jgi:Zn-dependent protease